MLSVPIEDKKRKMNTVALNMFNPFLPSNPMAIFSREGVSESKGLAFMNCLSISIIIISIIIISTLMEGDFV
jgi:hypothetical protein